jgi:hypothetical protein
MVRYPAHQSVQSVDFPDQMAFTEATNGRIAGHGADGGESVRDQRRPSTHAGGRSRGLAAGVAAADHDNIEGKRHGAVVAEAREGVKINAVADVSRETFCRFSFTDAEIPENHV